MISFYFIEALKYLFRTKLSTIIGILASSLALIFLSFSMILIFMSNNIELKLKENVRVNILLSKEISKARIDKLKGKISADSRVRYIKYQSADTAKKKFIKETGEDFSKLLNDNPLPASLIVKFYPGKININQIKAFVNEFRFANGVDDIIYDYNFLTKMLTLNRPLKLIVFFIALLLNIFAVYFVYSINKHFIISRKDQFYTMKLVGARIVSIKMPLLIASLIIGIISSLLVIIIFNFAIILFQRIYHKFNSGEIIYIFNTIILIFGILLSLLSNYFATRSISINLKIN